MFTLGIDYGTNSVRASSCAAPTAPNSAAAWSTIPPARKGVLLDPKDGLLARQHPGDYLVRPRGEHPGRAREAAAQTRLRPSKVVGIGVDTTGSSPIPVDAHNRPLALTTNGKTTSPRNAGSGRITPASARRPGSRSSAPSSARNTSPSAARPIPPNGSGPRSGIASTSRRSLSTRPIAGSSSPTGSPSVLAGVTDPRQVKRGVCAAGHKALYCDEWGGLPDKEFLSALDPRLADLRDRLYEKAYDATDPAGCALRRMGRRSSGFQRASRSPSASSTSITARSAAASRRARWSR